MATSSFADKIRLSFSLICRLWDGVYLLLPVSMHRQWGCWCVANWPKDSCPLLLAKR